MSRKTNTTQPEEIIIQRLRKAGYGEMTPLQQRVIPLFLQKKDLIVETGDSRGKTASYVLPLLDTSFRGSGKPSAVIIAPFPETVRKVNRQIKLFSRAHRPRPRCAFLGDTASKGREQRELSTKPSIVAGTAEGIIDHIRRDNLNLEDLETAVIDISEKKPEAGFDKDILFIFSKISGKTQTVLYTRKREDTGPLEEVMKRPQVVSGGSPGENNSSKEEQETETMKRKKTFSINERELAQTLKDFVRRIKKEENPDEMDAYKKIIRRNVPFTLRAYIGAYLLKEYAGKNTGSKEYTTLFISMGKNKKVFPGDLTKLFCSAIGVTNGEIGNIKILDNYSFLDITPEYADRAIETLNGTEYRGRRITVNHARKKSGE